MRNGLLMMLVLASASRRVLFRAALCLVGVTAAVGYAQDPAKDAIRTELSISGIYPHLTTYGVYTQRGGHFKDGHNECGIGAVVPWAEKVVDGELRSAHARRQRA